MRKLTKATTKVVNAELYGAEKLYSARGAFVTNNV